MIVGTSVYQTAARMGGIEGSKDKISTRNYLESVRNITELGFKQVELLLDPLKVALSEKELNNLMAELFKYKENTGVKYSVHLPFWWINIASPEKEIRKSSVKVIKDCIELTQLVQPRYYVLHVFKDIFNLVDRSQAIEALKNEARNRIYGYACESISEILSVLDDPGQLCIENLPGSNLDYLVTLTEKYNTSLCYDIGHKYITDLDEISFLKTYKSRIKTIHAHNIRIIKIEKNRPRLCRMEDHYSISEGMINFDQVISILKEINYRGSFIVEVKHHREAISSVKYLKKRGLL